MSGRKSTRRIDPGSWAGLPIGLPCTSDPPVLVCADTSWRKAAGSWVVRPPSMDTLKVVEKVASTKTAPRAVAPSMIKRLGLPRRCLGALPNMAARTMASPSREATCGLIRAAR